MGKFNYDTSVVPMGAEEKLNRMQEMQKSGSPASAGGADGGVGAAGLGGALAASGGNPYLMAAMVGLQAIGASKQRKAKERSQEYQAQISTTNRMQNSLSQLAGIGRSLKL